jgi:hypothetical protein
VEALIVAMFFARIFPKAMHWRVKPGSDSFKKERGA